MKAVVLYVGSSLLAPLRRAERDIEARYRLGLSIATHNCTLPLGGPEWSRVERDLAEADLVFVLHVTDSENAVRIQAALDRFRPRHRAVVVMNCLGGLMRKTWMGERELFPVFTSHRLLRKAGLWMAGYARGRNGKRERPEKYLDLIARLPALLRFVPSAGVLADVKHYLSLFCYFIQPTPDNIRCMILYAMKHYVPGCAGIETDPPEKRPATGIYHPDAPAIFASFAEYRKWYERRWAAPGRKWRLDPDQAVGLLLMRQHIVSGAHRHGDCLIRALEAEGLPVIPAISTFMDNREACRAHFADPGGGPPRVSQIVSLTGFSFVGGPANNDSQAAVAYLKELNRPLRTVVSLETQRVDEWMESGIGLNAVQTAMQVAIPELDGATEPFVYGGIHAGEDQPEPLEDRCRRIARRMARWNRLQRLPRAEVKLALVIYCFPPNKGNLGTAADLDVFPSLWEILRRLAAEGYTVSVPETPGALRDTLLEGDGYAAVAYRFPADEYYRLCPYVEEIEKEWGRAPGRIGGDGRNILIHGVALGNVLVVVQPTFGYEGDPMRLLMAKGSVPHHGFMGLYTFLNEVYRADAVVHVGTHGALEFMPGKQVGLSDSCWPDRLISSFPNIYIYSVNNPSEGTIAKRRSYAGLISYLTPPVEDAGLYKELACLKELLTSYRQAPGEEQRERLFQAIADKAKDLNI